MSRFKKIFVTTLLLVFIIGALVYWAAYRPVPETITYGVSFNTPYARELGLDWQEAYDAILDDLGVRYLRLAAHWPMIQPEKKTYNFAELDYQVKRAEEVGAEVIMSVGRRLPRWPECHIPAWAKEESIDERNRDLLTIMEETVKRYKDSPAIVAWQVENEPFLKVFAYEYCGEFDQDLFQQELDLVRRLDDTRPVLVTDSGNLGTWGPAYQSGDMFGTSVYVHFWNPQLGKFRTFLPPWYYRLRDNYVKWRYGEKETILIELAAEPWLLNPIIDTPFDVQYSRMNPEMFEDILEYAKRTRYDKQYLWGAEWWYLLKLQGRAEMWDRARELYR